MSLKSQQNNMKSIANLVSQDLGYIFGERESGPNGAKKEFLTKSASFLRALGKDLGFKEMKVNTNPAGIAVSGEVSLYGIWNDGNGVFFQISQSSFQSHGFLYRNIKSMKDYSGGQNMWLSGNVFAEQDYDKLLLTLSTLRIPTEVEKHVA